MSARPRARRRTRHEALQAQAVSVPILAAMLAQRGVRRLQWVWHGRQWRFAATGPFPSVGRALYAWTVALGPLELRRLAG